MTLSEFVSKYENQQLTDPFGGYKGECVSLVKRYAKEVQGINPVDLYVQGKAKNAWLLYDELNWKNHYKKVTTPKAGDIAVYDGSYGDIAVVISSTRVFGQYGTPVFTPARKRNINQPGKPLGYLRLIKQEKTMLGKEMATYILRILQYKHSPDKGEIGYWANLTSEQATAKLKKFYEGDHKKNKRILDAYRRGDFGDPTSNDEAVRLEERKSVLQKIKDTLGL